MVVVGGGPAGSRVAYKLAKAGHRVAVLERKRQIGEQVCCTGIIGQECVSSFDIKDAIIRRTNSAKLFSPSGRLLRLWREETQACILDRTAFNTAMAGQAQNNGAEYALDCLVQDIKVEKDRVRIEASHSGEDLNLEARAAVIASGFDSRLSEKLGLGSFGDFAIGAQAEVETAGIEEVEVYFGQEVAPGFFAWLVPVSAHTARVGLLSRKSPGDYLRRLMASLLAQGKITSSEAKLSYGGIPLKPLARTYGRRLMVVGDAAGQVKPTTGGGIYYGLLCADIAADILHRALENDDLSAKRLARYEEGWKRQLGWELKIGYWARKLVERLNDSKIDRIFDTVKADGIDEALLSAKDLSFDWHGRAILRLMGHRMVSKAMEVIRIPFRFRED